VSATSPIAGAVDVAINRVVTASLAKR